MDCGSNLLWSLRVSSHGICHLPYLEISWFLRAFLLTLLSVLSFHKIWSLPSILSSSSEAENCLQAKKRLWCFSQKSLKRIRPLISRVEHVSPATSILSLPVVHLKALSLFMGCLLRGWSLHFISKSSSGRHISKSRQIRPSAPVQLGSHPEGSTNTSSPWASSASRAVPGWATNSCHSSGNLHWSRGTWHQGGKGQTWWGWAV